METGKSETIGISLLLGGALLIVAGCANQQNQASADLPPASPAAYPSGAEPMPNTNFMIPETSGSAPPAPSFKPFSLRDGERLASYKAVSGDTLGAIASKFDTSVKRIQSANGLSNTVIYAGRTYKIPTKKSDEEVAKTTQSLASSRAAISTNSSSAPKPASSISGYTPPQPRESVSNSSFAAPPSTNSSSGSPSFAPRQFDYGSQSASSGSTPSTSSSITIAPSESSGSGAAFPTPNFGSGSSY